MSGARTPSPFPNPELLTRPNIPKPPREVNPRSSSARIGGIGSAGPPAPDTAVTAQWGADSEKAAHTAGRGLAIPELHGLWPFFGAATVQLQLQVQLQEKSQEQALEIEIARGCCMPATASPSGEAEAGHRWPGAPAQVRVLRGLAGVLQPRITGGYPMNDEQKRACLANDKVRFPRCRSPDIEAGAYEYSGDTISHGMRCMKCGAAWSDIYKLVDVEESP